jgi:hypothetical protein
MPDESDQLDRQLIDRLRAHEARVMVTGEPSLTTPPSSRVPVIAAAGTLLAAAALAVGLPNLLRPTAVDPGPLTTASAVETPAPTASGPALTPTSGPTIAPAMQLLFRNGDDDTIRYVERVNSVGDGLIAVVDTLHAQAVPAAGPDLYSAAVYIAAREDGQWEPVDTRDLFSHTRIFELVTPSGGQMVLYGTTTDPDEFTVRIEAWSSMDGRSWAPVTLPAGFDGLVDITNGRDGYVAATSKADYPNDRTELALFVSEDGVTWEQTYGETVDGAAGFGQIGGGAEGYVIVGSRPDGKGGVFTLASSDGRAWLESPLGSLGTNLIRALAPIRGNWVLAGYAVDGTMPVYWSANGLDWEAVEGITDPGGFGFPGNSEQDSYFGYASHLVSTGDRLFLSGARAAEGGESRPAAIWTSVDGRDWQLIDLGHDAEVRTAVRVTDGYLVGGRIGDQRGDAVVWHLRDDWFR